MSQNLPVDNIVVLSPANYAKALLTKIGKEVYSYGAWQHAIQVSINAVVVNSGFWCNQSSLCCGGTHFISRNLLTLRF